jgi:uncharacterized protein (TIGR03067 family)
MSTSLCLFLAAGLCIGADQSKDDGAKKELQRFQGKWLVISAEINGRDLTAVFGYSLSVANARTLLRPAGCTFRGTRVAIAKLSPLGGNWTVAIDPSKRPGHIDFMESRDGRQARHPGIYDIDGGRLRICFVRNGRSRPTKFSTKEGTAAAPRILLVMGRPFKLKVPPQDKGEVGKELRRFQGDWVLAWHQVNGRTLQEERRATEDALVIRGNRATIQIGRRSRGERLDLAFTIDPTKEPKQLDIVPEGFPEEVRAFGIYAFDGHRLRICFTMSKHNRPKAFFAQTGTPSCPVRLIVLHRLPIGAAKREELVKKEWKKLGGRWELVSLECNRRVLPVQDVKVPVESLIDKAPWLREFTHADFASFRIRANYVSVSRAGTHYIAIDPTTQPKSVDVSLATAKIFGIYRLDGGGLKVCLGWPGGPRPMAFSTKDGTTRHPLCVAVYGRAKSK